MKKLLTCLAVAFIIGMSLYALGGDASSVAEGEITFEDGARYVGGLLDGRFQGEGRFYASNGVLIYEGGFKDGMFDGQGTYTAPDGSFTYTGGFVSGLTEGVGVYRGADGRVFEGSFKNGAFVGAGE